MTQCQVCFTAHQHFGGNEAENNHTQRRRSHEATVLDAGSSAESDTIDGRESRG